MIKNKICKILILMIVVAMAITMVGQTVVFATKKTENKTFALSSVRKVKNNNGEYIDKGEFKLNTGSDYPIFQIISKEGTTITGTNYYCLKAKLGDTWGDPNNSSGTEITANTSYDLVEDKAEIGALSNTNYANIVSNNYGPVMWILDNMYCEGGLTTTQLLNNAGIEYGPNPVFPTLTDWHYNSDELVWQYGYSGYTVAGEDVIIDVAEIEAVQQAAIWHFTNAGDPEFDFNISEGAASAGYQFKIDESNADKKAMKQEQMAILYNYFVNNAKTKTSYEGQAKGTLELKYTTSNKIEKVGDNYRIGPLKATTTGTVTDLNIQITPTTGAQVTNATGEEKTFKANEDFYVTIPVSSVTSNVQINVTGKTAVTEKKLWLFEGNKTEQPIVEPKRTEFSLSDQQTATPNKPFDLALRKRIVAINGKSTDNDIKNEAGNPAQRAMDNITTNSIPDTAIYKHRKDPVVVKTNDIVTYRIWIYNEGDINGYASKIVDQLPTGMTSTLESTVTSNKGTTYNVNYDETNNKITLTAVGTTAKTINKWDGTTLSSDYVDVTCEISQTSATDGTTKQFLTNVAYIAEGYDTENSQVVTEDRNGNESKTTEAPTQTASQLNSTDANSYKGKSSNPSVYNDTDNQTYFQGQEDDDDFEKVVVLPREFDLKLMKFISKINDVATTRTITVNTSNLNKVVNGKKVTTADYDVSKVPLMVKTGDYVTYTFRIYNEGEVDGYASEITEDIPEGLEYDATKNTEGVWTLSSDGKTITTDSLSRAKNTENLIKAFDGTTLSYKEVSVTLKVVATNTNNIIRNEAEISEDEDKDGNPIDDRDSDTEEWKKENSDDNYENNPDYPKYIEDDEDYDNIKLAKFDLALRKFITKISRDGNFEDTKTTTSYNRVPQVDSSKLKAGTAETAIYKHSKEPVSIYAGDYILYTIRAYNEGDLDGYASEITDYLPENLDFVESTDEYINSINEKWDYNSTTRKVTTTTNTKLNAFNLATDNGQGSGLSYIDVQIICRANKNVETNKKLTNIAEISEYKDEDGTVIVKDQTSIQDRDSYSDNLNYPENPETYKDDEINKEYVPGQEDDDDFEKVLIKENPKFDLALRKFITEIETVNAKQNKTMPITNFGREPKVSYENGKITYTHPKDVVRTTVDSIVTYTLRVFNEGDIAGFAEEITDDIPEYLEFLPEHSINRDYKWVMYDEDGKSTTKVDEAVKIKTDYTSKANGELLMKDNTELKENPNLLNAFNKSEKISDTNPDYVDVKVAFKVKDPKSNKTIIVNKAQISEDADEDGNPVEDIDSVPDKWNEGEDDQDYENVAVDYFDLSLLKYVTKAIVTENGKTKTTKTGNNGSKNDITPKVEVYRKSLNKTIVKFEFTIKITNEGDIAGYAKEITDYVPKGLKFYKEDNKGWKDEGNNVISTKLLKDTLLQPGQSATVKVILRWINGENNLGLKTNVAEISEDYNEKGVPDRDSTPDNKKKGEDDIDDAPVLLTISTGILENTIQIITGALIVLIILGIGLAIIKKYVL